MIGKQDILDRATEWQLRPEVVEKDYVLGWVLAALARHPAVRATWLFKGGTCLKKCLFETYRFSEDLDFTLRPESVYDGEGLRLVLAEVARDATALSGIRFPEDLIVIRPRTDRTGRPTFEGRLGYEGPLVYPGPRRLLLDLTRHEPVLDATAWNPIYHPYPDEIPSKTTIGCYSADELLAEKLRALVERTRPRDLYDVVYMFENGTESFDVARLQQMFRRKCSFKGLKPPTAVEIVEIAVASGELRSEWANMLDHQLPTLPPVDDLLGRLPALLRRVEAGSDAASVPPPLAADSTAGARVDLGGARFWGGGVPLEVVRFAGANRLLVEFEYHGIHRRAEPYSLRRPPTGNLLLHAWDLADAQIKAFNTEDITRLKPTRETFTPRFRIEFTESGRLSAPEPRTSRARRSYPRQRSR